MAEQWNSFEWQVGKWAPNAACIGRQAGAFEPEKAFLARTTHFKHFKHFGPWRDRQFRNGRYFDLKGYSHLERRFLGWERMRLELPEQKELQKLLEFAEFSRVRRVCRRVCKLQICRKLPNERKCSESGMNGDHWPSKPPEFRSERVASEWKVNGDDSQPTIRLSARYRIR